MAIILNILIMKNYICIINYNNLKNQKFLKFCLALHWNMKDFNQINIYIYIYVIRTKKIQKLYVYILFILDICIINLKKFFLCIRILRIPTENIFIYRKYI